jgi:hypothetical protein
MVEGLYLHRIAENLTPIRAPSEIGTPDRSVRAVQGRTRSKPRCYRDWQNSDCMTSCGFDDCVRELHCGQ